MTIDEIKARINAIDAERGKLLTQLRKLVCPYKVGHRIEWCGSWPNSGTTMTGTIKRIDMDESSLQWWAMARPDGRRRGGLLGVGSHQNIKLITE